MTYPLITRNLILNAQFGWDGLSYGFAPMGQSLMLARLWDGDPESGGVEVSAPDYSPQFANITSEYMLSTDGSTHVFVGADPFPIVWGPATENWGDVTHWSLSTDTRAWVFPLNTSLTPMLIGDILRLSLPDLLLDPTDPTMLGPTEEQRRRILTSAFGNPFMPTDPGIGESFAATQWDVALFDGDPLVAGLEPTGWDYGRIPYLNDSGRFNWGSATAYEITTTAPAGIVWPVCQTDWGVMTYWGFYSNETGDLRHSGIITSHDPGGINAVAGTRIILPVGDWVAHLGEPV